MKDECNQRRQSVARGQGLGTPKAAAGLLARRYMPCKQVFRIDMYLLFIMFSFSQQSPKRLALLADIRKLCSRLFQDINGVPMDRQYIAWASMTLFAHVPSIILCLGFEKAIERSRWLGTPIEENAEEDENGEVACYTMKMCVEVPFI